MKMTNAGRAWLTVAVLAGCCLALLQVCAPFSFTKSIETTTVDNGKGTYYRLKVKLAYKGEPQDFDIVVGCNVKRITYKDNSTTYEAGLVPTVFGRRMIDGKGLVVRPPDACEGQTTENGEVQPDLLPIVIVYDDADTLDFGIAYLSEDAYESPLSLLKFGGATIAKATRAEFEAFRRAQPNLVKRESLYKAEGGDRFVQNEHLPPVATPLAFICEGYERYRVSDEARRILHQHWPKERPDYSEVDTYDEERALIEATVPTGHTGSQLVRSDGANDVPRRAVAFGVPSGHEADLGMPTRSGGGLVMARRGQFFPPAYYPATSDYRIDKWPADHGVWSEYINAHEKLDDVVIDFEGRRTKGFGYCFMPVHPDVPTEKRRLGRFDRHALFVETAPLHRQRPGSNVPEWIFERDEYIFRHFSIALGSVRGDV
jgi:hypothetical protein